MKNLLTLLIVTLFAVSFINAQSTERFIRIVGNASQEFQSNGTIVSFTVSEVPPNEYKQVRYKSIDQAYDEFVLAMGEIGISKTDLNRTPGNVTKYAKTIQRVYSVQSNDQKKLDAMALLNISGVKMSEVKYTYDFDVDVEQTLALKAIDDAKRKAKNICSELDMTRGKILNIEDNSSGCCSDMTETKEASMKKSYKVKVTFELID